MTKTPNCFASNLLMVRPKAFAANKQTMRDNSFQKESSLAPEDVAKRALAQFDSFADKLKRAGIGVHVVQDLLGSETPDCVFPNNWFSTHQDGKVYLYPMKAQNRRLERKNPVVDLLKKRFSVTDVVDLGATERNGRFLEGTGSIVFDHKNRLAYAALSERTDEALFMEHCKRLSYAPVKFKAFDKSGKSVYHTNVMLAMGEKFGIACLDMVPDKLERQMLKESFSNTGKTLIEASYEQTLNFCCNSLQVQTSKGGLALAMSERAWSSFTHSQKELIQDSSIPVFSPLSIIEDCAGGGARCMLAEIYLEAR